MYISPDHTAGVGPVRAKRLYGDPCSPFGCPQDPEMHIPPWYWFRWLSPLSGKTKATPCGPRSWRRSISWASWRRCGNSGLSPTSLNTRLRSIKAWCNWMVDWEIIKRNPTAKIKPTKVPKIRKPLLSKEAFQALPRPLPAQQPGGGQNAGHALDLLHVRSTESGDV